MAHLEVYNEDEIVICMKCTHSRSVRLTAFKKAGNSGNITCSGPALTPPSLEQYPTKANLWYLLLNVTYY